MNRTRTRQLVSNAVKLQQHLARGCATGTESPSLGAKCAFRGGDARGMQGSRLSAEVLEAWMNETLSRTEDTGAPGQLRPLDRHGVSIKHLIGLGLERAGIAQIYRALFVYSSGFYEMILSVLAGTGHKYRLAAEFWTVFAILLDSFCQSDYQMMVKVLGTGNSEEAAALEMGHQEELETLRQEHKRTRETLDLANNELKATQRDLQREIEHGEEMRAELLLKRAGHQDEVNAHMLFEGKVNLLSVRHREMDLKTTQSVKTDKLLEALKGQNTENAALKHLNTGLEQQINRLLGTVRHLEESYWDYVERVNKSYLEVKELNEQLKNTQGNLNLALSESAQKSLQTDGSKGETESYKRQNDNLELEITQLKDERSHFEKRLIELEGTFSTEICKHRTIEIESTKTKETNELRIEKVQNLLGTISELKEGVLTRDRCIQGLALDLESARDSLVQEKSQFKTIQEHMEQMNRGRRQIEEQNDSLQTKITEITQQLSALKIEHFECRDSYEKEKEKVTQLRPKIEDLTTTISSNQRELQSQRSGFNEKIAVLTEMVRNEKKNREHWTHKYSNGQKTQNETLQKCRSLQEQLSAANNPIFSLSTSLEELKPRSALLSESNNSQLTQLLPLQSDLEESQRKNNAFSALFETIDQDHREALELQLLQQESERLCQLEMRYADTWECARINLEKLSEARANCTKLAELNRISHEEFEDSSLKTTHLLQLRTQQIALQHKELNKHRNDYFALERKFKESQEGPKQGNGVELTMESKGAQATPALLEASTQLDLSFEDLKLKSETHSLRAKEPGFPPSSSTIQTPSTQPKLRNTIRQEVPQCPEFTIKEESLYLENRYEEDTGRPKRLPHIHKRSESLTEAPLKPQISPKIWLLEVTPGSSRRSGHKETPTRTKKGAPAGPPPEIKKMLRQAMSREKATD